MKSDYLKMPKLRDQALIRIALDATKTMGPTEAAETLGVSRQTIWRWRRNDGPRWVGDAGRAALIAALTKMGKLNEVISVSRATMLQPDVSKSVRLRHDLIAFLDRIGRLGVIAPHIALSAKDWLTLVYNLIPTHELSRDDHAELEGFREKILGPRPRYTEPLTLVSDSALANESLKAGKAKAAKPRTKAAVKGKPKR